MNSPPKCSVAKITGQILTNEEIEEYTNTMINWIEHFNSKHG